MPVVTGMRLRFLPILAALVVLPALASSAQLVARTNIQAQVTLAWTPSSSSGLSGYNMYQGGSSGAYTNVSFVAGANTTSVTLTNLVRGSLTFYAVTAVSTNGLESVYSNEVNYQSPALPVAPVLAQPTGR